MKTIKVLALCAAAVTIAACGEKPAPGPEPIKPADFKTVVYAPANETTSIMAICGSADGKYGAGSNFMTSKAAIWDLEKNSIQDISNIYGDIFAIDGSAFCVGQGNTDAEVNEKYAFYAKNGKGTMMYYDSSMIENDWGPSPAEGGSAAYAFSADQTIACGMFMKDGFFATPCIWKAPFTGKNDRIILPLPTEEEAGFELNGGQVRWMSDDASVLCGFLVDNADGRSLVIWNRQADGSYKADPICLAFYEPWDWDKESSLKPYMKFDANCLSPNGKFVGLTLQRFSDSFDEPMITARMNLQTKALEIMTGEYFEPLCISNDGTAVGSTPTSFFDPKPVVSYVWKAGQNKATDLSSMLPADSFTKYDETKFCYIAPDNSFALGWGQDADWNMGGFLVK